IAFMTAPVPQSNGANALASAAPGPAGQAGWRAAVARADAATQPATVTIEGTLERITFQNEANGWTIARLQMPRQKAPLTIAGTLPTVHIGEALRLEGSWKQHPQYGRQFQVSRYQALIPGTIPGLKKYLGSGLLKGVGPIWAEHLVNAFGFDTLEVLERAPERLLEIPGMGPARARTIARAWREQAAVKDLMEYLQAQGLPVSLALRIVKRYGDEATRIVRLEPYRLIDDVFGVSFELADQLATRVGLPADGAARIGAGLRQVLAEASDDGHTWMPQDAVLTAATRLLGLPPEQVATGLSMLVAAGQVAVETGPDGLPVVYPGALHDAELFVAGAIHALQRGPEDRLADFARIDWRRALAYVATQEPGDTALSERQQQAVRLALTQRVMILTGGPGTGKTTTLRAVIKLLQARRKSVVLAAPTGRAARRLTEATGAEARTIHRLLDLHPLPSGGYGGGAMLEADMVIVDEASMMDLLLAQALLRAVPPGSHLLLVGDPDQLPSVGAGEVLGDLLASGAVPTVKLTTIFRQDESSGIVANAHLINAGEPPRLKGFTDFYHLPATRPDGCCDLVVDLAARRLPAKYGLDPFEDIQVIAPLYQGPAGVDALNVQLQARLNPPSPARNERHFGARIFREGDKVMQVVNDYERQVFNGDIGRIVQIDPGDQQVRVLFDGEWPAVYAFSELDELTHAFAISVHKSQGSEYPVVVMPLLRSHGRMLQRNLLYTGISRARRLVVLVGEQEAVHRAVQTSLAGTRNTGLRARLSGAVSPTKEHKEARGPA
ncbi:MAG TPA: ATP-dependent RecD-like DNA helicase, partial [Chloroflexia bacterium]|nr:ATP-dependent RecD-like DNA helicase [Chloroflexia bacterium]